jgi:hypothetical protein
MRFRAQPLLLAFAGLILAFATLTHGRVVVPHLREDLVEIAVRPTLLKAVSQAMNLGALALAAMTAIVLVEAVRSYRGLPVPHASLGILGIFLVVLGVIAFQATHSHHALGYALIGVILLGAIFTK